jgi:transposase-like protein
MAKKDPSRHLPKSRRYSDDEKAGAVRMVRTLRAEIGTNKGTVTRVANQLGYGRGIGGRMGSPGGY